MIRHTVEFELKLEPEIATSSNAARITALIDNEIVNIIEAYIDKEMGADGGFYNVIKFREVDE